MKALIRVLAVAAVAATFLAITQRIQINAARTELARLKKGAAAVPAQATVPAAASSSVTPEEIARLRAENREIHKLRGQISQVREKRRAFEQMQAENSQLRQQIDRIKANPNTAATELFPLSNKGQTTPEAAIETTFWSMYQGDIERLSQLMPMVLPPEYERMPPDEKTNAVTLLRAVAATIRKFEILEQKLQSPDEAHITVRITRREGMNVVGSGFGPDQSTFVLRRTNDIWQITGER